MSNTVVDVSSADFESLLQTLVNYAKSQNAFEGFDFEGSTLNSLMRLLAYNAAQINHSVNMGVNESFLDSSVLRGNVVSLAKHLGYVPRSARSAKATIYVNVIPDDSPSEIIIPAGTKFSSTIDKTTYTFLTDREYVLPNSEGIYSETIEVFEGNIVNDTFTFSPQTKQFLLENTSIDLDSLKVEVFANATTTTKTEYTRVDDITELTPTSTVFFIEEDFSGYYKLYFGDDILGQSPIAGNVIRVSYRVCQEDKPNGATLFKAVGNVGFSRDVPTKTYSNLTVALINSATGGDQKESINSIKFYAPKQFEAQNRTVVDKDYKSAILNRFSYIQALNVWGGENHNPPIYGKVIISAKPKLGYVLTQDRKNEIIDFLKKQNVMSIEPVIIDPTFVYVKPTIIVNYDSSQTTIGSSGILSKVSEKIKTFEQEKLGVFDTQFRYSKFVADIDTADTSIVSNNTEIQLEKRSIPIFNTTMSYRVKFGTVLFNPFAGYQGTISSNGFKLTNVQQITYLDDDGFGNVRLYYLDSNLNKVYVSNVGTVDYNTGTIVLNNMNFENIEGLELIITAKPDQSNYVAERNTIILFSQPEVQIFDLRVNRVVQSGIIDVTGNSSYIYETNVNLETII